MIVLADLRRKARLTQTQLAEKIGVTPSCITMWETGMREPNIEKILKLSKVLNCTTDKLLGKPVKVKVRRKIHA